jgi:hypothetical protein
MLTPALIELASWTLATEMIRRAPKLLHIMETHPGGGQSDCLSIVRTDLQKWICVFNRIGSFTAFSWFDSGRDCDSKLQIDVWGRIAKGDSTREMLDEICNVVRLPIPSPLPAGTAASLTYRVITAALQIKTFAPKRWSCLNGFCDSSGFMGSGIRGELFRYFPLVESPSESEESPNYGVDDPLRFWFLCCDDEPMICLETTGRAYSRKGVMIDLKAKYARRRNVYDVLAEIYGCIA